MQTKSLLPVRKRIQADRLTALVSMPSHAETYATPQASSQLLRVIDPKDDAWYPGMLAHLRGDVNLKQMPFRPLVKWKVAETLIHALCNVLPSHVDESQLIMTQSFVWIPASILSQKEFVRGLTDGLVYVHKMNNSMQRVPVTNQLFVARTLGKNAYWVPNGQYWHTQREIENEQITHIGISRVLFQVIGRMIPEYWTEYIAKCPQPFWEPETIESHRLERKLKLESLRDDDNAIPQAEAVRATLHALESYSTVLLNGYCGSGKTVMMIELICQFGKKAAVLVNKQDLAQQWKERFATFAPKLRTKIVYSNQGDMLDCDVCICLLKSMYMRADLAPLPATHEQWSTSMDQARTLLVKRDGTVAKFKSSIKYPWPWLASIGLVLVDEAHRIIAPTALPTLALFPNAKIVCATATPDRQDSTHDSLGPIFGIVSAILQQPRVSLGVLTFVARHDNRMVPIHKWKRKKYAGAAWVDLSKQDVPFEDVNYSAMLRTLEDNEERNQQLLECIWDAAIRKQKQTLVLGLLKSHLVKLAASFHKRVVDQGAQDIDRLTAGLLFPETKEDLIDKIKGARVIFATFQFASEAFDVGTLSALVLVSPYKSRLVQVIGRILRRKRQGALIKVEDRACESSSMFPQGDTWSSLPLVYLARDEGNPWFEKINQRQLRLMRSTYEMILDQVHVESTMPWPFATQTLMDEFVAQGQVSALDLLFKEQDDDDLFGDDTEAAEDWSDEESWWE